MNSEFFELLNEHLADYSYVGGYQLSTLDLKLRSVVKDDNFNKEKLPHLYRWLTHVRLFNACERAAEADWTKLPEKLRSFVRENLQQRVCF